ncbi:DUF1903-domain-containing protein [Mycena floridula]|nr:DUF1903-domain-containing protein [Mycena floridula]
MSDPKNSDEPACQAQACSLHACLNKNTYKPEKCDSYVRELYECCQRMYEASGGQGDSTACPKKSTLDKWFKNHPKTS